MGKGRFQQIFGTGIGWSKQALHFNPRGDLPGITLKLTPVPAMPDIMMSSRIRSSYH